IFGTDFYLEVQYQPGWDEQEKVNKNLFLLGEKTNTKIVATKDVHYINKDDREAAEILLCTQTGKTMDDPDRMTIDTDLSLTSQEEMINAFKNNPEVIENTVEISNKCNLDIKFGENHLPHFKVPKGKEVDEFLRDEVYKGLLERYNTKSVEKLSKEIKSRADYELGVIQRTGFASYFLIVQDFVRFAKREGIMVGPGRGSAAGSIVSYALKVTDIDPLKFNLLFERFLNEERIAMPDIDMDFADSRREEVIQYVINKYGADHVAQIITFGTMMARGAIRDVGRALGMSYGEVDVIAKMMPTGLHLLEAIDAVPELKTLYKTDPKITRLLDLSIRLEGVARHASTHAAGVVISPKPLTEYVPLQKATKGETSIVTQYQMGDLESLGLLKMDFLGLSNLTVIQDALEIIEAVEKINLDINTLPLDDEKTFKMLSKGETTGVFQLESDGMKRVLKDLKPTKFEDIVAVVALYRPGPMQWIDSYVKRKHGKEAVKYLHPKLENSLSETYGIPVYQEQVMQIAKDIAGFSGPQADILRKAMGKKIKALMDKQKILFIEGAGKNGFTKEQAIEIFSMMEDFAQYGFNKSHAACYAMIAYWTAYLKAHYQNCFMAALLTSDQTNMDRVTIEVKEAERMGMEVLPPDVNESFQGFAVVPNTNNIRFGLLAIKNVGEGPADGIVKERKENGKYKSIEDFITRMDSQIVNKKPLEALIKSGALDSVGERGKLLANLEILLKAGSSGRKNVSEGQTDMFSLTEEMKVPEIVLKNEMKIDKRQVMAWEKELLGLYISEHPLKDFEDFLKKNAKQIFEIEKDMMDQTVVVGGVITKIHKIITRSKEIMIFATIEDTTGSIEVLVFPKMLENNTAMWVEDNIVLVKGRVSSNKDDDPKIVLEKARKLSEKDLKETKAGAPILITVSLKKESDKEKLPKIKDILLRNPGQSEVIIKIESLNDTKKIKPNLKINASLEVISEIEEIAENPIEYLSI
ncbi:DNA polymerase III subunit alpha, partial [bacterium]|nr:DNA polymerase III subunit alpha [bacterium]